MLSQNIVMHKAVDYSIIENGLKVIKRCIQQHTQTQITPRTKIYEQSDLIFVNEVV